METLWLNGDFRPAGEARIDPADRGFLLGHGAFETMRVSQGALRRWPAHRTRLNAGLDALHIAVPDWDEIETACIELARREGLDEAVIRLSVSAGAQGRGLGPVERGPSTVLITAAPRPASPASVHLVTLDFPRREPRSLATRCKLIGYGDAIAARHQALARGGDMALMLSGAGAVSGADCANIVWISGQYFVAPGREAGALEGTTRDALIEIARARGLKRADAADLPLKHAEAVLVCNAVMGVVPVAAIDEKPLPAGHDLIEALRQGEAEAG